MTGAKLNDLFLPTEDEFQPERPPRVWGTPAKIEQVIDLLAEEISSGVAGYSLCDYVIEGLSREIAEKAVALAMTIGYAPPPYDRAIQWLDEARERCSRCEHHEQENAKEGS